MKDHIALRETFFKYWTKAPRTHNLIESAPLVLKEDATTLFTSSGMQQLVVNLSGEPHPQGKRLVNIQPCFRATDIDEVGDNRHTTFFEMMGNWSLGDYFKEEQLAWCWEFFTEKIDLEKEKLYVTCFEGGSGVPEDEESAKIWKKLGVPESRIFFYGVNKNWWSRAGTPDKMPVGEIGGPDSEVFYKFTNVVHDKKYGNECHPNCDCGRFLEIGNSVFIQYRKQINGTLTELPQKNVDYGGGFERILAALNNDPDVFRTDLFGLIIEEIEDYTGKKYSQLENQESIRVVADHIKAAVFMVINSIRPSNKEHGYILRRLLRRCAVKMHSLDAGLTPNFYSIVGRGVLQTYDGYQDVNRNKQQNLVDSVISEEMKVFAVSLDKGLKYFKKLNDNQLQGEAFNLYQTYGFPFEITYELSQKRGVQIDKKTFDEMSKIHKKLSKKVSSGMFKGGLADHSEKVIKYHTATHLLHQALRDVLGAKVRQEGSNITGERLRFDFSLDKKPSDEEVQKVENIVNQKINEGLPVHFEIMPKEKADKIGALSFFREKYGSEVKVYFVGDYSKELCGGPHVKNTSDIGIITITRLKKIGANLIRIYAE